MAECRSPDYGHALCVLDTVGTYTTGVLHSANGARLKLVNAISFQSAAKKPHGPVHCKARPSEFPVTKHQVKALWWVVKDDGQGSGKEPHPPVP